MYDLKRKFYTALNSKVFNRVLVRGAHYRLISNQSEIEQYQIEKFNEIWTDAYLNVSFYKDWKSEHNLPEEIASLEELENWPILTKFDLQKNPETFLRQNIKPSGYIKTGGSTGEPLHLPVWADTETSPSMWLGRATYGIEPGMKTFLIWGHHHLYGKGLNRQINIFKRKVKDWLSNMYRVSSYDLSKEAMIEALEKYNSFSPEFVIGFSPSILSFCRINKKQKNKLTSYPKAVLCTAGPLSELEKKEISDFFQAPVCMEYGSVECGVMAYTEPQENKYKVFWDTHLIQGVYDNFGEVKNIVTRLIPNYVPMIRYDIGDYLDILNSENLNSIINVETVKGRPSDIVEIEKGIAFAGSLIGDSVKQVDGIIANQLHVFKDAIRIEVVSLGQLKEDDYVLIQNRLKTVVPGLSNTNTFIAQVDSLQQTVGGKTPLVVRYENTLDFYSKQQVSRI